MGNGYTEAQAQATRKYLDKKAHIKVWLDPEEKEKYKKAAEERGMNMTQFVLYCLEKELKA